MKNNTSKILLHIRKFMNRASQSMNLSAITAKVELATWRSEKPMRDSDYEYVNAQLNLSNANGAAIAFSVSFGEEYNEDLKGLNVLANTIDKFRKAVLEAKKIKDSITERTETDYKVRNDRFADNGSESEGYSEEDYND